jgi:3-hydroxyisobutyrate dehydrogenase-like beta-hydroxyacid dehydrogenase
LSIPDKSQGPDRQSQVIHHGSATNTGAEGVAIPENHQSAIGWIGVGKMGNPMATRLVEAGHTLIICDPVAENRASLVARGAAVAASPGDVAARCGIIFSTIPNDAVLAEMIFGAEDRSGFLAQVASGAILVEMSTVSPQVSARVAAALALRGVAYLRCPISGSTALARTGKLTALASGDAAAWEKVTPLMEVLAARRFYLGQGEEARYMKLVLNTLVGATASILGEALVLGETGGLTPDQMMAVISQSAVASPLLDYKREMIAQMDFSPAFSVQQMLKDFTLITDAARDKQVPMFVANLILQQYTRTPDIPIRISSRCSIGCAARAASAKTPDRAVVRGDGRHDPDHRQAFGSRTVAGDRLSAQDPRAFRCRHPQRAPRSLLEHRAGTGGQPFAAPASGYVNAD